jgi:hypothetical protein
VTTQVGESCGNDALAVGNLAINFKESENFTGDTVDCDNTLTMLNTTTGTYFDSGQVEDSCPACRAGAIDRYTDSTSCALHEDYGNGNYYIVEYQ